MCINHSDYMGSLIWMCCCNVWLSDLNLSLKMNHKSRWFTVSPGVQNIAGAGSAWCVLYITLGSVSTYRKGCSWGWTYSNVFKQQVLSSSLQSKLFRRRTAAWACDLWLSHTHRRSGQSDTAHMVFTVTLICNVTVTRTISLVTPANFPIQEAVSVCVSMVPRVHHGKGNHTLL